MYLFTNSDMDENIRNFLGPGYFLRQSLRKFHDLASSVKSGIGQK